MKNFICIVCGYQHVGDVPPERCPICKAPGRKFTELKREIGPNDDVIILRNGEIKIEPKDSRVQYYYVDNNGFQAGPVYPKEFGKLGVNKNTLVWRNGMTKWLPAGQLSELSFCFRQNVQAVKTTPIIKPQPPKNTQQQPLQNTQQRPDNFMVWAILSTIFCCIPTGIAAIVNANDVDTLWYEGKHQKSIEAMKDARKWTFISLGIGIASYVAAGLFGMSGVLFVQLFALTALLTNGLARGLSALAPLPLAGLIILVVWGLYLFWFVPALFNWCMG